MFGRSSSQPRASSSNGTPRQIGDPSAASDARGGAGTGWPRGSSDGDWPSAGTAGRRRSGLNGRTLAGAFFITVAAVIVFATWLSATRSHRRAWVVASRPLAAGTVLSAPDLRTASMQLPAATAGQAFSLPASLFGRVLSAPIGTGGLVQATALVPAGQQPAVRPVSINDSDVDLATLAPGEDVDVLVTEGTDTSAVTSVVLRSAQVISVTRPSNSVVGGSDTGIVTLGVHNLAEVESVVQASHAGTVAVVAGERGDGEGLGAAGPAGAAAAG